MKIERSEKKNKKYKVKHQGKYIHFGDKRYQQFKDTTGLGLYSKLDHNDKTRQKSYCSRSAGIKDKNGKLTKNDKNNSNYYARKFLWSC